ncbi:licB [Symbiodinium natans]|uniref:LicB protein n=1 Tax=Symbiodinium natans TaxID=878477 RepID=A0A812UG55_9DINO|nr:licB [Symbiodinium natans]
MPKPTSDAMRASIGKRGRLSILMTLLWSSISPDGFATGGQHPLSTLRERKGLALSQRSGPIDGELSKEGQRILSLICEARERGDWRQVRQVFATSTSSEIQIFNAVMQASIACNQNEHGAQIYDSLCNLGINKTATSYTAAIRIFTSLGRMHRVRDIWTEAISTCQLDEPLGAARIAAAATEGDVESAAVVLDQMNGSSVDINVAHLSSALRACWQAEGNHHNAAKYLFQVLLDLDLQPNIVTFTNLTQRAQYCLIKQYTLNHIGALNMI